MVITAQDLYDAADDFDDQADLLERFAGDRYADSAVRYRGGSSTFVRSIDTADGYRKEAAQLRAEAREYREVADHMAATEAPARPRNVAPGTSRARSPMEEIWQRMQSSERNR
ncbi:hypothetical protein LH935_14895 [Gordonia polyisoprenivorans]|uniref:hypothetical protein n=1 Tax=Gordonia polyisoprenivorans TaxID=84595 RepID=UPI0022349DE8|nr:hypothetical protein LH935_14895 [Gordonia polyisoprenivorans]